jgi:hypothetical protein
VHANNRAFACTRATKLWRPSSQSFGSAELRVRLVGSARHGWPTRLGRGPGGYQGGPIRTNPGPLLFFIFYSFIEFPNLRSEGPRGG